MAQNIKNAHKCSKRGSSTWEFANSTIQAGFILHYLFLHDFPLLWPENLHHFSNWNDNFWFNAIWHRWSVVTFIFCRWLARSDVVITPWVICMDWLCWWYNHVGHVVSTSKAQTYLTNRTEKCKSTSPSAIQVKYHQKTINTEEKSNVISWLEKDEQIVDISHNVKTPS